ncbi:MAG TPA: PGF-pre-PGF domain-containing protein [Methanosarcina sp.]
MELCLKLLYLLLIIGILTIPVEAAEGYGENISANSIVKSVKFLTDSPESELFPVWTADGNYILYTVKNNESGTLNSYKMKANGSEAIRTRIGEGNLTGFNDLNPNGTELIVTKSDGHQSDLYRIDMESGKETPITNDPNKSESWGAWCRLGRKIIHTEESSGFPSQLWIVDRDGSNNTRLGTSENVGTGKDWNPLGLKVIYSAKNSKEKPDLWMIDWYGTNQTQLTDTPYGEWNPAFSSDGKRIVYVSDEGGSPELWLRDIQGSYRVKLTENLGITDAYPKWSPEGSKIVFTGHSSDNSLDIAVIELASSAEILPSPKITNVSIEPFCITSEGESANISITVKNEGKSASEGYISLSFPNGEKIEEVGGTGSNIKTYAIGDSIQGKSGEILAQYPSVELLRSQWDTQQEETLNVTIKPNNNTERIIFFTRASFKNNFTGAYENDPLISTDIDQQGFNVYAYSINVSKSSLKVILEPQTIESEAKWKITTGPDTEWHPSNYRINNLTAGNYIIQFCEISGWKIPDDMTITINGDSVNTGIYTENPSSSSSSGGGHGGGSVITSLEPSRNIEAKETASKYISSGSHVVFDFPMNVTCITNLEFDPKKTFQKTTTTIEMLKEKSSQVPQLPPGQIYKSVNIQVGNTGTSLSGNIENASIGFKVDRTWIRENTGKKSVICLWRYNQTSWNKLEVQKTGEDDRYSYFKSRTPDFLSFAITAYTEEDKMFEKMGVEKIEPGNTSNLKKTLGNNSINEKENNKSSDIGTTSEKEENGTKQGSNSKINSIIVISLPLLVLLIYLEVKKQT